MAEPAEDPSDEANRDWNEAFDAFLEIANAAIGDFDRSAVSAALLYGCSRYNVYMQKMAAFGGEIDEDAKAYLLNQYRRTLREHMQDDIRHEMPEGFSDRTSEVLEHIDERLDAEDGELLALVERLIGKANELHRKMPMGRVSAGFMHACARFNVYVMQLAGMPPGAVHEAQIDHYAGLYAALLEHHNSERLETHTSTWIRDRLFGAFLLRVIVPCARLIRRLRR